MHTGLDTLVLYDKKGNETIRYKHFVVLIYRKSYLPIYFFNKSTEICFHIFLQFMLTKYWCRSSNPDASMSLLAYPLPSLEASLKLKEQTGPVCTHRTLPRGAEDEPSSLCHGYIRSTLRPRTTQQRSIHHRVTNKQTNNTESSKSTRQTKLIIPGWSFLAKIRVGFVWIFFSLYRLCISHIYRPIPSESRDQIRYSATYCRHAGFFSWEKRTGGKAWMDISCGLCYVKDRT